MAFLYYYTSMCRGYCLRSGFTFLELCVVILIVLTLIVIAIPAFLRAQQKAVAAEALATLNQIRTAQTFYRADYQLYSPDIVALQEYLAFDTADTNWTYDISTADTNGFTAVATRNSGRPYAGFTISLIVDITRLGIEPQSSLIEYRDGEGTVQSTYPPE